MVVFFLVFPIYWPFFFMKFQLYITTDKNVYLFFSRIITAQSYKHNA